MLYGSRCWAIKKQRIPENGEGKNENVKMDK